MIPLGFSGSYSLTNTDLVSGFWLTRVTTVLDLTFVTDRISVDPAGFSDTLSFTVSGFSTGDLTVYSLHGGIYSGSLNAAPEPSTWAMMLLGFAGLGFVGYRRNRGSIALAPPTGRDTHLA
jgi:hypothetical protein